MGNLLAVSDLHVAYPENRELVTKLLLPEADDDWLIVAGDVGELMSDVEWALDMLASRFAHVVWVPGNHELWTLKRDPCQLRGVARYRHLVEVCRSLGISTPEDSFPVWHSELGDVRVAPLFQLYDYTFLTPGTTTRDESLAAAYEAGIVCTDEYLLDPAPHPSREAWSSARVDYCEYRLEEVGDDIPLVLVSHWPLVREPTRVMRHQEFPQWCGTVRSADWHLRFGAVLAVYGHLHIPRTTVHDGVPFEEVSLGYPREWRPRGVRPEMARTVLRGAAR